MCTTCWASFFMFPTGVLKCKRASAYSRWRWCRGGTGLQRVREFHSHHPSFPPGKAWICARVCGKKKKRVCQILSPQDRRFPHLDTHSQLPAAGSVSAPRLQQRLHFLLFAEKKVVAQGEECVFSLRMALHERFQTGNSQPRDKGGALIIPVWSDQGWTQPLEFGSWDIQAKKQMGMHLVLGHSSVQNLSPLFQRQPQLHLEGSQLSLVQDRGRWLSSVGQNGEINYPDLLASSMCLWNVTWITREREHANFTKKTSSKDSALPWLKKTIKARLDLCSHC